MGLKRLLKLEVPEVLGLDISETSVKLIQLQKKDGRYTVLAANVIEIPESDNVQEELTIKDIGTYVNKCWSVSQANTSHAVCSVSGPEVAIRDFEFPILSWDELENAVQLEATQVCPFNVNEGSVDYQLIGDSTQNMRGYFVAATNRVVHRKVNIAKEASLHPVMVDVDGLALLNCFVECGFRKEGEVAAILNVGSYDTNFVIIDDKGLPRVRDFSHGDHEIVRYIADACSLNVSDVRDALTGAENSSASWSDICHEFENGCERILGDIDDTLRYYNAQRRSVPVDTVYMCGEYAVRDRFVDYLKQEYPNITFKLWDPFVAMELDCDDESAAILQKQGPNFAVAAGLAMRAI